METELIFYTNPKSRGGIVRWMLEEVGANYKTQMINYGPEMKTADYLKINPMGKVPAIEHRGKVVTEAAAICAYLADAFPQKGLAPSIDNRADYYRWLFFASGPLEAAITNKTLGVDVPSEKQGFVGYGNYDLTIKTLANAVSRSPYLTGNTFTAADVYVGAQIGWGMMFKSLPELKEFKDYWARVSDRPAHHLAQQKDKALT